MGVGWIGKMARGIESFSWDGAVTIIFQCVSIRTVPDFDLVITRWQGIAQGDIHLVHIKTIVTTNGSGGYDRSQGWGDKNSVPPDVRLLHPHFFIV